jgi:hypothetical protein
VSPGARRRLVAAWMLNQLPKERSPEDPVSEPAWKPVEHERLEGDHPTPEPALQVGGVEEASPDDQEHGQDVDDVEFEVDVGPDGSATGGERVLRWIQDHSRHEAVPCWCSHRGHFPAVVAKAMV